MSCAECIMDVLINISNYGNHRVPLDWDGICVWFSCYLSFYGDPFPEPCFTHNGRPEINKINLPIGYLNFMQYLFDSISNIN